MKISHPLIKSLTGFLLCLLIPFASTAQEADKPYTINVGVISYYFNNDKNQEDDLGFQLGFEAPLVDRWSFDVQYWGLDSDLSGAPGEGDLDFFHVGAKYNFDRINGWQPYLGIGIGNLDISRPVLPDIDPTTLGLNAGIRYFFDDSWVGKIEAMFIEPTDSYNQDWALGFSIGYRFGGASRPGPAVTQSTPPQPAAPAPVDSDGDGVFDDRDACAGTPRGVSVDARGCELDSDRDGVVDSRDACPGTNMNLAVDNRGCVILDESQRRQTLAVLFATNMSEIQSQYQDEIAAFADFLREYNNTSAVIEGHTDSDGSEEYNQALSERRARAVMMELINRYGIAASRLSAVGYGESRPVASNATANGKAQNRRIEAEVTVQVQAERQR